MDNMTLRYMNKCIYVFSKIYQKFSKISAVGLVIISAIFVLCVMGPEPVKLGFFESQKAPIENFRVTKQECLGILCNVNKWQYMH